MMRVYDHPRMVQLETVSSLDLPDDAMRASFVHKQNLLLDNGCVELIARIIMAHDNGCEDGDLSDSALEVNFFFFEVVTILHDLCSFAHWCTRE